MQSCTKITAEEAFEGQRGPMAEQPARQQKPAKPEKGAARSRPKRPETSEDGQGRGVSGPNEDQHAGIVIKKPH